MFYFNLNNDLFKMESNINLLKIFLTGFMVYTFIDVVKGVVLFFKVYL